MKKIVTVIGARPQFIKAATVSRAFAGQATELLVHTGQHYDRNMSDLFFEELGIPEPAYNLGVGSGGHGAQTGEMLARLEQVLLTELPDWVLVYGDTNSTLAGALAAAKLHIPVAHVEAGLRSFNRRMPEEINRVLTDHISRLLFAPTEVAVANLAQEGITAGVMLTGDVMYDGLLYAARLAAERPVLDGLGVGPKKYGLLTVHRADNTDQPARLRAIMAGVGRLDRPVIFPVHPRTRGKLAGIEVPPNVRLIEPVGYLDMLRLQMDAQVVLTDSGGVQKEAFLLGTPCVTLREETEWLETVTAGMNVLVGADADALVQAAIRPVIPAPLGAVTPYGDGRAAERIVAALL